MTAFSSQRPSLRGRTLSAGTANAGSTAASICITWRVLLPTACSTSAFRADTSSTGAGFRCGVRAGAAPFGFVADPIPDPTPRVRCARSRSRRSKAACNCAAASSVSEPSRSRSRAPSIRAHSFMALIRRHAEASL